MKKFLGFLFMAMCAMNVSAQDTVEAEVSVDVVSKYVWRGQELGKGAIQPSASVSYKGFSLGAWGSYGIVDSSDTEELDFTLSYSTGGFTIGVTDYWFSGGNKYFSYAAHETSHVWEANVGYDFGPASINWYTNFAGDDGYNKSGKRAYSSYFEVAAPFHLAGLEWQASLGAVPYATSFYADASGFAITNVALMASKDVKITDHFSLPLFAQLAANPSTGRLFFSVGLTIK